MTAGHGRGAGPSRSCAGAEGAEGGSCGGRRGALAAAAVRPPQRPGLPRGPPTACRALAACPLPPAPQDSPINRLAFQLIPATLGQMNFQSQGCTKPTPADMFEKIAKAHTLIGSRVPLPLGDGRCACCSDKARPCADMASCEGAGACAPLTDTDVSELQAALDAWNQHQDADGKTCK